MVNLQWSNYTRKWRPPTSRWRRRQSSVRQTWRTPHTEQWTCQTVRTWHLLIQDPCLPGVNQKQRRSQWWPSWSGYQLQLSSRTKPAARTSSRVELERTILNFTTDDIEISTLTVCELQAGDGEQDLPDGDDGVLGKEPHDVDLVVLHYQDRLKPLEQIDK